MLQNRSSNKYRRRTKEKPHKGNCNKRNWIKNVFSVLLRGALFNILSCQIDKRPLFLHFYVCSHHHKHFIIYYFYFDYTFVLQLPSASRPAEHAVRTRTEQKTKWRYTLSYCFWPDTQSIKHHIRKWSLVPFTTDHSSSSSPSRALHCPMNFEERRRDEIPTQAHYPLVTPHKV